MSKLTPADAARLIGALQNAVPSTGAQPPQGAAQITAVVIDGDTSESIDAALTSYLAAPVRCTLTHDAAAGFESADYHFAAEVRDESGTHRLQLALSNELAVALADVAIGGTGRTAKHGKRARTGALLEPIVDRIIAAITPDGAGRRHAHFTEAASSAAVPLRGGVLAIADLQGNWSLSEIATPAAAVVGGAEAKPVQKPPLRKDVAPHPVEIVHPMPEPVARAQHPPTPPARERLLAPAHHADRRSAFGNAIDAACAQLRELTHSNAQCDEVRVERVDVPALPPGDLKLALIAGGQGSLVLSADRAAVDGIAAAAVGAQLPASADTGAVVLDAVEAVLRAAMRGFAEKLPGISGGALRFVRLAEGTLPARSPHDAIAVPVQINERPITLQWLVPAWMVSAGGAGRSAHET